MQVSFSHPRYANISWDTEFVGMQFDDDQNLAKILPTTSKERIGLPGYSVSNVTASRTVNHQVEVFVGVQNLFGKLYYVGTNPTTIGTPRLVNGGIRLRVGR
jgi:outer membrane receptor protein involved in Fe transport